MGTLEKAGLMGIYSIRSNADFLDNRMGRWGLWGGGGAADRKTTGQSDRRGGSSATSLTLHLSLPPLVPPAYNGYGQQRE